MQMRADAETNMDIDLDPPPPPPVTPNMQGNDNGADQGDWVEFEQLPIVLNDGPQQNTESDMDEVDCVTNIIHVYMKVDGRTNSVLWLRFFNVCLFFFLFRCSKYRKKNTLVVGNSVFSSDFFVFLGLLYQVQYQDWSEFARQRRNIGGTDARLYVVQLALLLENMIYQRDR